MEKSQLIKLVAKETGYSISHVSNVLSGKRKNANISKAIIKLQSASLIKKVQTPAVVKGIKFNHQTDDFSEALGVTLTEATFKKGVSFESKRKSIVAEQILKNIAKKAGKEELSQRDIDMFYAGFIFCQIFNPDPITALFNEIFKSQL